MSHKGDVVLGEKKKKKRKQSFGISAVVFLNKDKRMSMPLCKREEKVCLQ